MNFNRSNIDNKKLVDLYKSILVPRLIEEKIKFYFDREKISKWFSGIGQESCFCRCIRIINQDEPILPLHRNLGVFTTKGIQSQNRLFSQFMV